MAANRQDSLRTAIRKTTERGGLKGFYQGLIPWVSSYLSSTLWARQAPDPGRPRGGTQAASRIPTFC